MSEIYFGYFRAPFFYVGFVRLGEEFVRVGFYRDLGEFEEEVKAGYPSARRDDGVFRDFVEDLEAYFSGERVEFDHPFRAEGTRFQLEVWDETRRIPFGETRSYGWVAARIGRPRAARAVANALRSNRLVLIIPCHRVVRKTGEVAGRGFGRKVREYLIRLEQASR
ncbi:MAG: methylated-DNA--[protein]-cysteine S-methyltransferase [Thaumarchaeota archaeon]|nr:methylated-DNA--[protein]-cysteine S-methyltransferase [Nitrososphaerota archaeon]